MRKYLVKLIAAPVLICVGSVTAVYAEEVVPTCQLIIKEKNSDVPIVIKADLANKFFGLNNDLIIHNEFNTNVPVSCGTLIKKDYRIPWKEITPLKAVMVIDSNKIKATHLVTPNNMQELKPIPEPMEFRMLIVDNEYVLLKALK